ncbi:DNA repair protein RecO [Bacillus sp. SG-1]|nr:DNA repair protein RecO [Bacillus sp. SG-1]
MGLTAEMLSALFSWDRLIWGSDLQKF